MIRMSIDSIFVARKVARVPMRIDAGWIAPKFSGRMRLWVLRSTISVTMIVLSYPGRALRRVETFDFFIFFLSSPFCSSVIRGHRNLHAGIKRESHRGSTHAVISREHWNRHKWNTVPIQISSYRGAGPNRIYMFYDINSNLAAAVKNRRLLTGDY